MKKNLCTLLQILLICLISFFGNWVALYLPVKMPGSLVGMGLLLILLFSGLLKLRVIEQGAALLLKHMAFFFIPAAVGIIHYMPFVKLWWFPWLTILLATTAIVLAGTSKFVDVFYFKAGEK